MYVSIYSVYIYVYACMCVCVGYIMEKLCHDISYVTTYVTYNLISNIN